MIAVQHAKQKGEILTGLLYMEPETSRASRHSSHDRKTAEYVDRSGALTGIGGA